MSFGGKPTQNNQNKEIKIEGYPTLSTAEFRQLRRIPFVFDETSMAAAIEIAADSVQGQLSKAKQPFSGANVSLYKRAVYSLAHADLLPEFATQNRRDEAENTAEDAGIQGDRFRAQSTRDISQILCSSSNSIGLI